MADTQRSQGVRVRMAARANPCHVTQSVHKNTSRYLDTAAWRLAVTTPDWNGDGMAGIRRGRSRGRLAAAIGLAVIGVTAGWGGGSAQAFPAQETASVRPAVASPADGTDGADRANGANGADGKSGPRALTCPPVPLWVNTGGGGDQLYSYSPTGTQL
ncbi:hypothetical protein ACFWNL_39440, partial [Kitasatospora sp. NPDC058397]